MLNNTPTLVSTERMSIVCRDVSKTYFINKDGYERSLTPRHKRTRVDALLPMSFAARKGEAVGIIGKNGSGKSTLLSLIAGHEKPTTGEVFVSAQPSLLSVGAALNSNLTGRENVRLGLLAKGLSPGRVAELQDEVAEWAEIDEAIDRPLHTYSSGMRAKLRFSISTAVRPEILLVDEALATGDSTFAAKADERMKAFLGDSSSVFIVSHAASTIRENTTRAIWIHEGETLMDGESGFVCSLYARWGQAVSNRDRKTANQIIRRAQASYTPPRILFEHEAAKFLDTPQIGKRK